MVKENNTNLNYEELTISNNSSYTFHPIFDTIDSTNTYIKNNYQSLKNKSVIVAKGQTNGRGRYDRNFLSNDNKGIYCSFVLKENLNIDLLNIRIACALHDSIKTVFKIDTQIKWPNDIIINQKKCAGVLIETQYNQINLEAIIIGFGLNIFKQEFDSNLSKIATTLEDYRIQTFDCNQFLNTFFNKLDYFLYQINALDYFKKYMIPKDSLVNLTINKKKETVKIVDININGQLIVETLDNEKITLFNDEITL